MLVRFVAINIGLIMTALSLVSPVAAAKENGSSFSPAGYGCPTFGPCRGHYPTGGRGHGGHNGHGR